MGGRVLQISESRLTLKTARLPASTRPAAAADIDRTLPASRRGHHKFDALATSATPQRRRRRAAAAARLPRPSAPPDDARSSPPSSTADLPSSAPSTPVQPRSLHQPRPLPGSRNPSSLTATARHPAAGRISLAAAPAAVYHRLARRRPSDKRGPLLPPTGTGDVPDF